MATYHPTFHRAALCLALQLSVSLSCYAQCEHIIASAGTRASGTDHDLAVSGAHIVSLTNTKAAITNKPCGSTPLVSDTKAFFDVPTPPPGLFPGTFDPEVLWGSGDEPILRNVLG